MLKISKRMKEVKQNVENLLQKYPETRGNDNLLIWFYWINHDEPRLREVLGILGTLKIMHGLTSAETIRRTRQKLQEKGDYLPKPDILEKRLKMQSEMREWAKEKEESEKK